MTISPMLKMLSLVISLMTCNDFPKSRSFFSLYDSKSLSQRVAGCPKGPSQLLRGSAAAYADGSLPATVLELLASLGTAPTGTESRPSELQKWPNMAGFVG